MRATEAGPDILLDPHVPCRKMGRTFSQSFSASGKRLSDPETRCLGRTTRLPRWETSFLSPSDSHHLYSLLHPLSQQARKVLSSMARRVMQNKIIMAGIILFLLGAIGIILYVKLR